MSTYFRATDPAALEYQLNRLRSIWNQDLYDIEVEYKFVLRGSESTRSQRQNNALHLYCENLAIALNDAGYDQRAVLEKMKEGVEVPWSKSTVKENLWKPIQAHMFRQDSTTRLKRPEVDQVYQVLSRWIAQNFGVTTNFPEEQ